MAEPTFYEVLGVRADATPDEVRRAYRAAARKLHPDTSECTDPKTEARFREVARAYQTLRDSKKRRRYDEELAASQAVGQAHYTWTNIATDASIAWADEERRERATELDAMYDAFFGDHRRGRTKKRAGGAGRPTGGEARPSPG